MDAGWGRSAWKSALPSSVPEARVYSLGEEAWNIKKPYSHQEPDSCVGASSDRGSKEVEGVSLPAAWEKE